MLVYITIIIAVIALVFEFRRQLMMLQQNSYRNDRYSRWLSTSQDSTSAMRLVSGAVLLASLSTLTPAIWISAGLICAVSLTNTIILVRKKYKKPLVMTRRASRILLTMLLLAAIPTVICLFVCQAQGASLIFVVDIILAAFCFSQSFALVANWLLKPVEANINRKYYQDAERILRGMPDLKIIGVTGSYGKTSTKHYLNRILSEKYDVMMTPGSFNTTMGVIRTVREYLKPYNEVFIVEMGAKQPGDIKEICDLVHPEIGIVTAVGEQHLESFKTIENVQRTKFELIDSLPTDGLAVVNNDFPFVANRKVDNVKCIRYAVSECGPAEYIAEDIRYSAHGTSFTVVTPTGEKFGFSTHLVGECNVSNLLAAIIVALRLEVPIEKIRYAVNDIQQVEHRLNMKRTPGGVTIIDDAFNSNPTGSKMALDVLKMMTGGRRIIVTPGMIELGERQEELNAKFGEYIAGAADIAIIVGHYNREAIISGIKSTDTTSLDVHAVNSFSEAQQLLATTLKPGDTILYENDLPDTFK
ncbi:MULTISPECIES: Mur ligase family protein [Duncaniella]|uniref:Mur ligase family protein n=1 Tax=Duncaniella TaxID=2518495 RepID=UPI000F526C2F|nr:MULTISPECIES: Mur ligase family protein [Duncaniella]NBH92980.1 UDP-N-acetylmuramoyl-tripeptide--D-alanyl-D-alanine ligase [Muribaculaceae bacterium S4]NBI21352.1 UDP-N-acetylmuramoyl-tripeptide--D-alanyl-D-alanine ligase [Muribaculaceae bacterium Z1]ROS86799.1 UDP-N-acetylmuramoyl-tripeptide--D-alanyl-D-alanine ligase [Muribaculaceae bacterium Isolate-039 (Harlan)]QCD39852.1 UDP-N-acetylmuramoyl-tripeptide--D-alanyl-D-alanine ligase [Duncaniella sp. C9]QCP73500.1 UDP-N-acetylmuramoyl-tripe